MAIDTGSATQDAHHRRYMHALRTGEALDPSVEGRRDGALALRSGDFVGDWHKDYLAMVFTILYPFGLG